MPNPEAHSETRILHQLEIIVSHLERLERKGKQMATRADFDALKAELKVDVATIVQKVADLQAKLTAGDQITDQDLTDLRDLTTTLTGGAALPPGRR